MRGGPISEPVWFRTVLLRPPCLNTRQTYSSSWEPFLRLFRTSLARQIVSLRVTESEAITPVQFPRAQAHWGLADARRRQPWHTTTRRKVPPRVSAMGLIDLYFALLAEVIKPPMGVHIESNWLCSTPEPALACHVFVSRRWFVLVFHALTTRYSAIPLSTAIAKASLLL